MDENEPLEEMEMEIKKDEPIEMKTVSLVKWKKLTQASGPVPRPRHGHRAVVVKDLIVVFGGGNEGIIDELHIYNTAVSQWVVPQVRGEVPPACAAFGMVVSGQRILIFGGMIEYGRYSDDLYELQAARWEWRHLRPRSATEDAFPCARLGHSFVISPKTQKTYIFGGLANDSKQQRRNIPRYLNDLFILDVSVSNTCLQWEKPIVHGQPPIPRESHSAVIHETSKGRNMIVFGGMNGYRLNDLWFFDLDSLTWTEVKGGPFSGIPPEPRSLHTAVTINDKMYIYGGWVPLSSQADEADQMAEKEWKCTSSLACFDMVNRRWEPLDLFSYDEENIPRARAGHCAVVIGSRMYCWSGRDGYRKAWSNQVCCRDLWVLETMKPEQPGRVQLIRASFNSLDISWAAVPTSEVYLVQIAIVEPKTDATKSGAPSANLVKFIRGHIGQQQVVRVVKPTVNTPVAPNKTKAYIIAKEDGATQKVVYLSNEVNEGAPDGQKVAPTSSQSLISTQGTTYTSTQPQQQQPMDESGLPHNLFDESGAEDGAPTSPAKPTVPAVTSDSAPAEASDPATASTSEQPQQEGIDNGNVTSRNGNGDENPENGSKTDPAAIDGLKVENDESSTMQPAAPTDSTEQQQQQAQENDDIKPNLDELRNSLDQNESATAPVEVEDRTQWFDIGLLKTTQCNVSHYFSHGYPPLVQSNDPQTDQDYADHAPLLASDEKIPKASKASLESGTTYRFRVAGINGLGRGAWSEVSTFKTCLPGYPSAPSSIRITKGNDGAQLTWEPPGNAMVAGRISEYSVYLAVKNSSGSAESQLAFMRVYVGCAAECCVPQHNLQAAYVDQTNKPAIIFRIAARNEKGYGPATQVRWLQDQKASMPGVRYHMQGPAQTSGPAMFPFHHQGSTMVKRARME